MANARAWSYQEAFSRNIGLLTPPEQERLRRACVAIAGLGGVGGVHALTLARLGIGRFHLADLDVFEPANMNRQAGAFVSTLGQAKTEVMARLLRDINPEVRVVTFGDGIHPENIDAFLDGVDVAIDGVDFFLMGPRRLLFRRARERGIYAITSGPVGFGATLHIFSPAGMSFDEFFDLRDGMSETEQVLHFGLGLAPKLAHIGYFPPSRIDLSRKSAPSLGPAVMLCAGVTATETLNLILKRRKPKVVPHCFQFDPFAQAYKKTYLWWGNRNPVQRLKKWWLFRTHPALRAHCRGK